MKRFIILTIYLFNILIQQLTAQQQNPPVVPLTSMCKTKKKKQNRILLSRQFRCINSYLLSQF